MSSASRKSGLRAIVLAFVYKRPAQLHERHSDVLVFVAEQTAPHGQRFFEQGRRARWIAALPHEDAELIDRLCRA